MSKTLELAIELISKPSVTPEDHNCQNIMATRLQTLGFKNEHLRFAEVDNLWSRRGTAAPLFVVGISGGWADRIAGRVSPPAYRAAGA